MAKPIIKFSIEYKDTSDMIKAAIKADFKHIGGSGFQCKNCGNKSSARKFIKGKGTMYGCNLCQARWGSLIKEATTDVVEKEYSELKVMFSATGFYIGREDGIGCQYSRESGYYHKHGAAEKALKNGFEVRDCAENNHAYDVGALPDIRK